MKKLISCALCALLLMSLLSISAAESDFEFDSQTGTITKYLGTETSVKVPEKIDGVTVRAIGVNAFGQNAALKEVTLPEGLTHILASAFYFCDKLHTVRLPDSLQAIDSYAFFSCSSLGSLTLPANLVSLDDNAFAFHALNEIRFTGPLPFVSSQAFEGGKTDTAFFAPERFLADYQNALGKTFQAGEEKEPWSPDERFEIDPQTGLITAYEGSNAKVVVPAQVGGTAVLGIADRAMFANPWIRVVALPEGLKSIGKEAFLAVPVNQVVFPSTLLEIGDDAFMGAPVEELTFPQGLLRIGKGAFKNNQLKELRLPESLEVVSDSAFHNAWKLETLYLPENLKQIDSKAFYDASLLSYLVFEGSALPEIAEDAFFGCGKLVDIDIKYNATAEDALVFTNRFEEMGFAPGSFYVWRANHPSSPAYPSGAAFTFDEESQLITSYQGDLNSMTMYFSYHKADGSGTLNVKGLGDGVFEGSRLERFYVPHNDDFTTIGKQAFKDSKLTEIDLFDTVSEIGDEAFAGCENLREITLPASVLTVGKDAFKGCIALESVTILAEGITLGEDVFADCGNLKTLVLPGGTVLGGKLGLPDEAVIIKENATEEERVKLHAALGLPWYRDLPKPSESADIIIMPDDLIPTPENEFEFDENTGYITKYLGSAERVIIPREIKGKAVAGIAYPGFSSLTVVSVAEGTQDNLSLKEVIIPETVNFIEDSAFLNCAMLKKVDCYGPITRLGIRSFENCVSLEEVVFHNGIWEIDLYAFNKCEKLHSVVLGQKTQKLGEGAFFGCGFTGVLTVDAPVVDNLAYAGNAKVEVIRVSNKVTQLGEGVFQDMAALKEVYFDGTDAGILGETPFQFSPDRTDLKVYIPAAAGDEALADFVKALNINMLPGKDMVSRKDFP